MRDNGRSSMHSTANHSITTIALVHGEESSALFFSVDRSEKRGEKRRGKEANEIMINIAHNAFLLVLAWRRCCSFSSLYQNRQQTKGTGKEKQTERAAERPFDLIVQGHLSSSLSHLFLCSLHDDDGGDDDEKSRREKRLIELSLCYPIHHLRALRT